MKLSRREAAARTKIIQQGHMKKKHQQFLDRQIKLYRTSYQDLYNGTSPAFIAIKIGFLSLFFNEASVSMKQLAQTMNQMSTEINSTEEEKQ